VPGWSVGCVGGEFVWVILLSIKFSKMASIGIGEVKDW
jgi:hypothetical protein